jgi:hypothetical protein
MPPKRSPKSQPATRSTQGAAHGGVTAETSAAGPTAATGEEQQKPAASAGQQQPALARCLGCVDAAAAAAPQPLPELQHDELGFVVPLPGADASASGGSVSPAPRSKDRSEHATQPAQPALARRNQSTSHSISTFPPIEACLVLNARLAYPV